ncbi:MAG: hypothetical protein J6B45_02320 [Clostridia bacterium]|nr:hypothetical protein [Clostridia bacterium]
MKKYIDFLFAGVLAYCSIGLITGIINMISFFQIITTKIRIPGGVFIDEEVQELFIPRTVAISIIGAVCVCAVAFACIYSVLKRNKQSQIVAMVISSLSLIGSLISLFAINNISGLPSFNSYYLEFKSYYDFTIQQMLSDTAKSIFIPIIAVSVMLIIRTAVKKSDNENGSVDFSSETQS